VVVMTVDEVNGIARLERILAEEEDVAERLDPQVERAYRSAGAERAWRRAGLSDLEIAQRLYRRSGDVTPLGTNTYDNDDAPAVLSSRGA
jgi:hypothetical protein